MNSGSRGYRAFRLRKNLPAGMHEIRRSNLLYRRNPFTKFQFLNEQEREKIIRAGEDREYKTEYEKMTERGIRFIPYFLRNIRNS